MDINTINALNSVYEPLHKYAVTLLAELKRINYNVEWGYYNLHSTKCNDEFVTEFFPIPVITVRDICDIIIELDNISIEGKLERNDALKFNFSLLEGYDFEVYGVDDYLHDFYNKKLDIAGIQDRIKESAEKEIGIQTCFKLSTPLSEIIEIIKKYNEWNTYILL